MLVFKRVSRPGRLHRYSITQLIRMKEVLGELQRAQEAAFNLREIPQKDHLTRAKICSKLIKYPNIEDYTVSRLLFRRNRTC